MSEPQSSRSILHEHLDVLLDAVEDAVFTIDCDYEITAFNHAAEQATSLRRADVVGRRCYEIFRDTACIATPGCPVGAQVARGDRVRGCVLPILMRRMNGEVHCLSIQKILNGNGHAGDGLFREAADRSVTLRDRQSLSILDASERRAIENVLTRHNWNRSLACQELGISRTTLWRKMRKLDIQPPAGMGEEEAEDREQESA